MSGFLVWYDSYLIPPYEDSIKGISKEFIRKWNEVSYDTKKSRKCKQIMLPSPALMRFAVQAC